MTNREGLKKVISSDFDKKKNYSEIMKKINKRKGVNYWKIGLIPVCLLVFVYIILNNSANTLKNSVQIDDDNNINVYTTSSSEKQYHTYEKTITNEKWSDEQRILANLRGTVKIDLLVISKDGDVISSNNKYKKYKTITSEKEVRKILDATSNSRLSETTTNSFDKLIRFYDASNRLLAEYNGSSLMVGNIVLYIFRDKNLVFEFFD